MKQIVGAVLAAGITWLVSPWANGAELSVFGLWATPENRSHIDFQLCDNDPSMICGTVAWLQVEVDKHGMPLVDNMNDDPALRHRPRIGLEILRVSADDEPNRWIGSVYDPEVGNIYKAKVLFADPGNLSFSGCILIFCRNMDWPRVTRETSREHLLP